MLVQGLEVTTTQCRSSAGRLAPAVNGKLENGPAVVLRLNFPENFGELTDYLAEYEDGKMTARGRVFCENLGDLRDDSGEWPARYRPSAA